ncbi:MAG: malto-oligosyltrehalose synthase, partial [Terriglobia bacterium]
ALKNKVLLPILGAPFGRVVENGELVLTIEDAGFFVNYHDNKLPVSVESYRQILSYQLDSLECSHRADEAAVREIREINHAISRFSPDSNEEASPTAQQPHGERIAAAATAKARLLRVYRRSAAAKQFIDDNLSAFNGRRGDPASFSLIENLLDQQHYWLSFWRLANEEINYRRFFTISELVGIRVEDPRVFEETHALFKRLIDGGAVGGIRVDHIDGLRDPADYLHRLQSYLTSARVSGDSGKPALKPVYMVVEKILAEDETLRKDWPVSGTTGYDFLNILNGVFIKADGLSELTRIYGHFVGSPASFEDIVHDKKILVMETLFGGEMSSLGSMLGRLAERDRYARDLPLQELAKALVEITACFPVYRTYIRDFHVSAMDQRVIQLALREAQRRKPALNSSLFDFLRRVLMLEDTASASAEQKQNWLDFVMRWQQFTGPIMAKGCEDTALYVYNRLVSANEVGGNPSHSSVSLQKFHHHMQSRRIHFPHTLNATTTHDTKRSEDVRARINVLSEIPEVWERHLNLWSRWNESKKKSWRGQWVPDRNEEVLLYQTLIGAWPLQAKESPAFRERLQNYVIKAAREAKAHTRWIRPDVEREKILAGFVQEILNPSSANRFLRDFLRFQRPIAFFGALNSLSQLVLKICSPGVPDFYQGGELWDLRLVDPDNRGPVDFSLRARLLESLRRMQETEELRLARDLLEAWQDGRIKLYVTSKALNFRTGHPRLFLDGDYVPLEVHGPAPNHVCAFARRYKEEWTLVAVPRMLLGKSLAPHFPLGPTAWGDENRLLLPAGAPPRWKNVFTGEAILLSGRRYFHLHRLFQSFPVALLAGISRT